MYLVFFQLTDPFWQKLVHKVRLDQIPGLLAFIQRAITFTLIVVTLIFFRSRNLSDATYILTHLFLGVPSYLAASGRELYAAFASLDPAQFDSAFRFMLSPIGLDTGFNSLMIVMTFVLYLVVEGRRFDLTAIASKPVYVRWAVYALFLFISLLFSVQSTLNRDFIYFRF